MKVLITGGAGFIGSHLAEELLARGATVYVLDDLSTGSLANLATFAERSRLRCIVGRVEDAALLDALIGRVEAVYHLAAVVGVRLVVSSPVHTIERNLRATECVLTCAAASRCPVFIASSSEVYGQRDQQPCREDENLRIGPTHEGRWSYACSKAMNEFLALAYHRQHGVPVVVGRLFNTVGPRQVGRYGMVLPTFVDQALAGEPITVLGDGEQTRCFAHVGDVVRGIAGLMQTPAAYGGTFNLGSNQELSINALAAAVKERTGSASPIVHRSYGEAYGSSFEDMRRRVPDLSRIRDLIGYRPEVDLEGILERVIAFKRSERQRHEARCATC